jgi:hypothetical protein
MRHWMDRMSEWRLDDFGGSVNDFKQVGRKSAAVNLNLEESLKSDFLKHSRMFTILLNVLEYSKMISNAFTIHIEEK